jgi:hypothetical protein
LAFLLSLLLWTWRYGLGVGTDANGALLVEPARQGRKALRGQIQRASMPWGVLPEHYGPYTTVYNRFNRWYTR